MDDTIQGILAHGSGEQLAKLDIESTYRLVPVDPDERPLLGMWWRERLYICTALSFGLSSEPITLSTVAGVASALQYITEWKERQRYCNYLDDFRMFRSLNSGKISTSPRHACEARSPNHDTQDGTPINSYQVFGYIAEFGEDGDLGMKRKIKRL